MLFLSPVNILFQTKYFDYDICEEWLKKNNYPVNFESSTLLHNKTYYNFKINISPKFKHYSEIFLYKYMICLVGYD
jgi:hypothetical protein